MRNFLKRLQIKGFVLGVLMTALLSGMMLVAANTQTVTREVTYGVGVILNGNQVQFNHDSRPFVMDGRTFLPLRTLAELLGLPVDFDPVGNNAIVGTRTAPAGGGTSLNVAAPFFDVGGVRQFPGDWWTDVTKLPSVEMGGAQYTDVVSYQSHVSRNQRYPVFSLHNLNARYRMFTGHFGRVDGSPMNNATIRIYGDGNLLFSHVFTATDMPIPINIFVEGVRQLRVEVYAHGSHHNALQGFLQ